MRQLREILERVRKGEEVDVEKELGTGNPEQEREWFEVMKHIEETDNVWYAKERRQEKRRLKKEQAASNASEEEEKGAENSNNPDPDPASVKIRRSPSFY
ncbi:hypothetical protein MMC21_000173 [Puttea exsequens]|nr:hypothetical protein [Puttea exsequens]